MSSTSPTTTTTTQDSRLPLLVPADDDTVPERVKPAPPVVHQPAQPAKQVLGGILVSVIERLRLHSETEG